MAPDLQKYYEETFSTMSTRGWEYLIEDFEEISAMARLYYLKEQVKHAIFRLINSDFSFDPGIIGKKGWPSWRMFQTSAAIPESEVAAGRWSFDIEYSYIPKDIDGLDLDEIFVDSQRWSAIYNKQGD